MRNETREQNPILPFPFMKTATTVLTVSNNDKNHGRFMWGVFFKVQNHYFLNFQQNSKIFELAT